MPRIIGSGYAGLDLAIGGGEMILYRITPEVRLCGYEPGEAETLSLGATVTGRFGTEEGRAEHVLKTLLLRTR